MAQADDDMPPEQSADTEAGSLVVWMIAGAVLVLAFLLVLFFFPQTW